MSYLRGAILTLLLGVVLAAPAGAAARSVTASEGGVAATLSYSGGPGITTKDERLAIRIKGHLVYDLPVPATGCFKVCGPEGKKPVQVAALYGNDGQDIVLTLFTNGADCCTIDDVLVPSAAVGSYVLNQHNFGEAGAVLKDIGPDRRPEFVSADPAFYCRFTACYASALPVQIFEFSGERFVNLTRQHPHLLSADAERWMKLYARNPKHGLGAITAWAADEENLGEGGSVHTVMQEQIGKGDLTAATVARLESFLKAHHYG